MCLYHWLHCSATMTPSMHLSPCVLARCLASWYSKLKMEIKANQIHSLSKYLIVFHASEAIKGIEPMTTPTMEKSEIKLYICWLFTLYMLCFIFVSSFLLYILFKLGFFPNKTRHKSTIRLDLSEEYD
ncbi:uncharacterized protein LOC107495240 [Arachis duranensis]|uniref:Uncharacterized protein LOC107495240 n=1 Tax=Arachis duranensis TaxID=130453 RepID=A0A9C6TEA9_ARADU|nr:uncharacterized protein LOC107495240 [Arachis duranensis]